MVAGRQLRQCGSDRCHRHHTRVMPEREIWKPRQSAAQVTPVVADSQTKEPTPIAVP
jgi:hypothetical protein